LIRLPIDRQGASWDHIAQTAKLSISARSSTMAKPPSKRRGINLDSRADTAEPLDRMTFQTADFPASAPTSPPAGAAPTAMPEVLAQLRRMSADLDSRWQHQEEQLRQQRQQLEQQREQIAEQTRQLRSLEQARRSTARLGFLLTLLAVVGVSALGFHGWPRLQEVAGNLSRVNTGVSDIAPELQAMQGQLTYLDSGMGQMRGTIASLREEVSGLHSELGSLRSAVNRVPPDQSADQAASSATRQVAHSLGQEPGAMSTQYRRMHPMRPW
jgi:septal ring factor EnvC (AmiA/AmiB activator)